MKFFCGFYMKRKQSVPIPKESETILTGKHKLYVCGDWKEHEVQVFDFPFGKFVFLGECLATKHEIEKILLREGSKESPHYHSLAHLPGNFNLIVLAADEMFLYSDMSALRPIYYSNQENYVIFASTSLPIQQLIEAPLESDRVIMSFICAGMTEFTHQISLFQGINRVPPITALHLSPCQHRLVRYWQPKLVMTLEEATIPFRQGIMQSIHRRLHNVERVSAEVSGGLDSTTLALVVADKLQERHRNLIGLTLKSPSPHEAEDVNLAVEACQSRNNIDHLLLEPHEYPLPYESMDEVPLTDEPIVFLTTYGWIYSLLERARLFGSELHISGDGGDNVLVASYTYLTDLCRFKKLGSFLKHTYGWSRVKYESPWKWIWRAYKLRTTPYTQWIQDQVALLYKEPNRDDRFGWSGSPVLTSWLTKDIKRSVGERLVEQRPLLYSDTPGMQNFFTSLFLTGQSENLSNA
ncbi:asparagine synthase-related protein [Laceyella tengchongensis]|uniref:asparagine synthase-related protein n=1 Tax=Laceyella tengchongensis TaxID=574699 RepID=UPI001890378E